MTNPEHEFGIGALHRPSWMRPRQLLLSAVMLAGFTGYAWSDPAIERGSLDAETKLAQASTRSTSDDRSTPGVRDEDNRSTPGVRDEDNRSTPGVRDEDNRSTPGVRDEDNRSTPGVRDEDNRSTPGVRDEDNRSTPGRSDDSSQPSTSGKVASANELDAVPARPVLRQSMNCQLSVSASSARRPKGGVETYISHGPLVLSDR